jgi:hypothetical protein
MVRTRLQITVRLLMIVVAFVAVAIGSEVTRRRWASYRKEAAGFANLERGMLQMAGARDAEVARLKREAGELKDKAKHARDYPDIQRLSEQLAEVMMQRTFLINENATYFRQRAAVYAKLKKKYWHAAHYPWLPVEPDPPEPE